jgi:unsaturated rhamnogalacturonyl hydrolase
MPERDIKKVGYNLSRTRYVKYSLYSIIAALLIIDALWLGSKLWSRIKPAPPPIQYTWKQLNQQYVDSLKSALEKMLLDKDHPGAGMSGEEFDRAMGASMAMMGHTVSFELTQNQRDANVIKTYIDCRLTADGKFKAGLTRLDECMMGWPIIELYLSTQDKKYANAAKEIYAFLDKTASTTKDGTLQYSADNPDDRLVDSLGLVCPFLSYYGKVFNEPKAQELSVRMLKDFLEYGIEPRSGLPCHGFSTSRECPLGLIGWTRGAGWLMLGLTETIRHLPATSSYRQDLCDEFRKLTDTLISWRKADGCWGWNANKPDCHLDTSGSSMIAYSIERAIHSGFLDVSYYLVTDKALACLVKNTRSDGLVDNSLGDSGGVGIYPQIYGPAAWAQGPTTALCILILDRESSSDSRPKNRL